MKHLKVKNPNITWHGQKWFGLKARMSEIILASANDKKIANLNEVLTKYKVAIVDVVS